MKSSLVYGFAVMQVASRKNNSTEAKVPVAQGMTPRLPRRFENTAIAEYKESMSNQNSIDPAWPLQNAAKTYAFGRLALVYDATYSNEKSCVKRAVHNPIDAESTAANVTYIARSPLSTRSRRASAAPANETVAHHVAISRATQSASSPIRITLYPGSSQRSRAVAHGDPDS
jgi:hypothetical protein